jgi:hypothetical protein
MALLLPLQTLGKELIKAISLASDVVFKVTMQMSTLISKPVMQMVSAMKTTTEIAIEHQPKMNPEMRQAQQW